MPYVLVSYVVVSYVVVPVSWCSELNLDSARACTFRRRLRMVWIASRTCEMSDTPGQSDGFETPSYAH